MVPGAAVLQAKWFFSGGIASPARIKVQSLAMEFWRALCWHGQQQFKGGLKMNLIDQFGAVMLGVSQHQWAMICRWIENLLAKLQQLRSGLGHCLSRRGQRKTKRLATLQVQAEKALRHFERLLVGIESVLPHLAFSGALNAMRINRQQSALEVAAGAPDFTQCHLQRLGLGDTYGILAIHE